MTLDGVFQNRETWTSETQLLLTNLSMHTASHDVIL
jgi:hypothetical protein